MKVFLINVRYVKGNTLTGQEKIIKIQEDGTRKEINNEIVVERIATLVIAARNEAEVRGLIVSNIVGSESDLINIEIFNIIDMSELSEGEILFQQGV